MSSSPIISIRGLEKIFPSSHGPVHAVQKIDLDVIENEFVVLLGPSGCGKTTTLRCVAGLERPDAGRIASAGQVVNSVDDGSFVPPERRDIGMVFQSYAVWPHLNVYQNVALPLTDGRRKVPKNQIADRVMESLRLVRLDGLENRPVTDLSGGQQQRVALARAVVTQPMVLLMDEPLSNLDARLREEMRLELKKIANSVGVTTLYVTHDQAEALSLGDKICVMDHGVIQQMGSPQEVYSRPPNRFVAEFVGEMNFIAGKIKGPGKIDSPLGEISCAVPDNCSVGGAVTMAVRPHHLGLAQGANGNASPQGTILSRTYLGDAILYEVGLADLTLLARLPGEAAFDAGQKVSIVVPTDHWHIYPD